MWSRSSFQADQVADRVYTEGWPMLSVHRWQQPIMTIPVLASWTPRHPADMDFIWIGPSCDEFLLERQLQTIHCLAFQIISGWGSVICFSQSLTAAWLCLASPQMLNCRTYKRQTGPEQDPNRTQTSQKQRVILERPRLNSPAPHKNLSSGWGKWQTSADFPVNGRHCLWILLVLHRTAVWLSNAFSTFYITGWRIMKACFS